jgi:WhiB family transcriptional regulator, redox-sensing transcriptional regulator
MARHGRGSRTTGGQLVFLEPLRRFTPPELPGALCADRDQDPDLWFPRNGDWVGAERAMAICRICPVRERCLQWALDNGEREGIWGGTTPGGRRQLRKARAEARTSTGAAA